MIGTCYFDSLVYFAKSIIERPPERVAVHFQSSSPLLSSKMAYLRAFWVPTDCIQKAMFDSGTQRSLWAQDYLYGLNEANYDTKASLVKTFLEELPLDEVTKEDIAHRNAEKLFGI